jgi:hypothetical protein
MIWITALKMWSSNWDQYPIASSWPDPLLSTSTAVFAPYGLLAGVQHTPYSIGYVYNNQLNLDGDQSYPRTLRL